MTIDTTKLRELAQTAEQGPWFYELDHGSYLRIFSEKNTGIVDGCGCCGSPNCDEVNATFIAAANPATVLTLLDEIDRLRAIEAAARNLVNVKGQHNSEQAMNQLLETLK